MSGMIMDKGQRHCLHRYSSVSLSAEISTNQPLSVNQASVLIARPTTTAPGSSQPPPSISVQPFLMQSLVLDLTQDLRVILSGKKGARVFSTILDLAIQRKVFWQNMPWVSGEMISLNNPLPCRLKSLVQR